MLRLLKDAVQWLGFEWKDNLYFTSDYFPKIYDYAITLIKMGKAYVDSLTEEEIREYRGTVKEAGKRSIYANRSVEENLDLLERMKKGEFKDGEHVLRAKIDMSAANMKMRDPLLYRIRHANHFRSADEWCIYQCMTLLTAYLIILKGFSLYLYFWNLRTIVIFIIGY